MSREGDKKIALWAGTLRKNGACEIFGKYTTSDADAISLLPVLMARDYSYCLKSYPDNLIFFQIYDMVENPITRYNVQPTIAKAVSIAVLSLVAKEPTP